jgi:peptidoglycan/xylan/chitin deacetylase (PgdA/CDA1 family)
LRGGAVVLLYHRVAAVDDDPLGLAVHPDRFAEQMEVLADRVVPLDELLDERASGSIAITFDDGYADNLAALTGLQLPVTLFVSTGHVEQGLAFWWDQLGRLAPGPLRVSIDGRDRAWRTRQAAREALQRELQARDAEQIAAALDQAGVGGPPPASERPMTIEELRGLHAAGVTVGAHTRTHRGLAYAPQAAQREEIERSRDDLAAWLGETPGAFSYPFGVPGADVGPTTVRLVQEAGFGCAVVNDPRTVHRGDDRFAIPRFAAPDLAADAFERWLRPHA